MTPPPHLVQLRNFAPIGLETMDATAALRRRIDTKYVLTHREVEAVLEELCQLGSWHRLVIAGSDEFSYSNIYFDHDLTSFRHHTQKRHRRFKIRSRHYSTTRDTQLELKIRSGPGYTSKERIARVGHTAKLDDNEYQWLTSHLIDNGLEPHAHRPQSTTVVRYIRSTLVQPEQGERITIDHNLSTDGPRRNMELLTGAIVVEIKSSERRSTFSELLLRHGHRPQPFSKYCAAAAASGFPFYGPSRDISRRIKYRRSA